MPSQRRITQYTHRATTGEFRGKRGGRLAGHFVFGDCGMFCVVNSLCERFMHQPLHRRCLLAPSAARCIHARQQRLPNTPSCGARSVVLRAIALIPIPAPAAPAAAVLPLDAAATAAPDPQGAQPGLRMGLISSRWSPDQMPSMAGKTAIVTGEAELHVRTCPGGGLKWCAMGYQALSHASSGRRPCRLCHPRTPARPHTRHPATCHAQRPASAGGDSGIGFEAAKALAAGGATVVLAVRDQGAR